MDHRFQQQKSQSRSRSRERKPIVASDLRSYEEGNGQFRKQTNAKKIALDPTCAVGSSLEEHSFALEFRRSSSKKANGTPIKPMIHEEMPNEMKIRRTSPSVIARLMGLDTLPPPLAVHKQRKELGSHFQKTTSIGFQEKYVPFEDHLHRMSTRDHQEFKDVFEVMEMPKIEKHKNRPVSKGMPSLKGSETDMAFIKQKFIDAKCLLADETLQNSKEYNDEMEALDSSKDVFLKFLQEPNTLFSKHLEDLKCTPSPHPKHIATFKLPEVTECLSSEVCCQSEQKAERCAHMRKDVLNPFRKSASSLFSHSLKEHSNSLSHKLSKSRYTGKTDTCLLPTEIVVLKPSLKKTQSAGRTVSLPGSTENLQFGYTRHREFRRSGIQELFAEGRDRWKLSDNPSVIGHMRKGSRGIAKEVTEQMRHSVNSGTKKVLASGLNGYIQAESSRIMPGTLNLNNFEALRQTDECNDSFSHSETFSTESSVSREARIRLSERWKMTHRFQEVGLVHRGSSTLGEMLALSDRVTPKTTLDSLIIQKVSDEKLARDEVVATSVSPSGISSRDGWKDRCSRNLRTSRCLSASSIVYPSPKSSNRHGVVGNDDRYMLKDVLNLGPCDYLDGNFNQRGSSSHRSFKCGGSKPQSFNAGGAENKLPVQDIHVNPEEWGNRIHVSNLAEEKHLLPDLSVCDIADAGHLIDHLSVSKCEDANTPFVISEEQVQQPMTFIMLAKDGESSFHDQNDVVTKETSFGHPKADSLPSLCNITESASPVSYKEIRQPSPVSVLEPSSEEEKSSLGYFERVSADLQELRVQLQLLKLDSAEESQIEDTEECPHLLQTFQDEEDRDFSYLLDILIDSGVYGADRDALFSACYSPDYPVGPGIYDKLEKKYNMPVAWSKSERRLLFDLINSILSEVLAPCMDLHPWVKSKRRAGLMWARVGLVEEVWQTVARQRKELPGNPEQKVLESETRWLDLRDDVDMIGREIEKMIKDDLLEELVSGFILG